MVSIQLIYINFIKYEHQRWIKSSAKYPNKKYVLFIKLARFILAKPGKKSRFRSDLGFSNYIFETRRPNFARKLKPIAEYWKYICLTSPDWKTNLYSVIANNIKVFSSLLLYTIFEILKLCNLFKQKYTLILHWSIWSSSMDLLLHRCILKGDMN